MINLLPPEQKQSYVYARRNRILMHWVITCMICLLLGIVLAGGGYVYLNQSIKDTKQQIADSNTELQTEKIASVQKQVTSISNNLKLAVQVLSKEILFSKLLKRLASVTPDNVILTNFSISDTQTGVDLTAQTANYNAATQLQVNLADPNNQIFSKADIVSINCNGSSTNSSAEQYPCTVDIRALFATDNPFLFINETAN